MNGEVAATWQAAAAEARTLVDAGRDPYAPIAQLSALYRRLGTDDQAVVDGLITADLNSDDSGMRYDAMWLIREFKIRSAIPVLQTLATRLASSSEVGAPFEIEKIERLIGALTDSDPTR